MYERHHHRVLSRKEFGKRVAGHFLVALSILGVMLGGGVAGYHFIARLPWIDSLLNASMILGGMGPVDQLPSGAAKLFASTYALLSGLVFVALTGVMLAPFFHRLLHRFHMDDEPDQ